MRHYIQLRLGSHVILHGFDADNQAIEEHVQVDTFSDKIVALDRILSISEKYILTAYADGRYVYWEYEGEMATIADKLAARQMLL